MAGPPGKPPPNVGIGGKPNKGKARPAGSTKVQKQDGVQRVLIIERPMLSNEDTETEGHTESAEEKDKRVAHHRILISEKMWVDLDKVRWIFYFIVSLPPEPRDHWATCSLFS
jgi:hypothetical protein